MQCALYTLYTVSTEYNKINLLCFYKCWRIFYHHTSSISSMERCKTKLGPKFKLFLKDTLSDNQFKVAYLLRCKLPMMPFHSCSPKVPQAMSSGCLNSEVKFRVTLYSDSTINKKLFSQCSLLCICYIPIYCGTFTSPSLSGSCL